MLVAAVSGGRPRAYSFWVDRLIAPVSGVGRRLGRVHSIVLLLPTFHPAQGTSSLSSTPLRESPPRSVEREGRPRAFGFVYDRLSSSLSGVGSMLGRDFPANLVLSSILHLLGALLVTAFTCPASSGPTVDLEPLGFEADRPTNDCRALIRCPVESLPSFLSTSRVGEAAWIVHPGLTFAFRQG